MNDLLIVSNRGPFSFSDDLFNETREKLKNNLQPPRPSFGEGGLVQSMAGLLRSNRWNTTWIGASMGDRDIDVARGNYRSFFKMLKRHGYAPERFPQIDIYPDSRMRFRFKDYDFHMRFVFFDTSHMRSYYRKFANGFLWPLMHLTRSPLFYKKGVVFPRPSFTKNDFVQCTSSSVTFANAIIDEICSSQMPARKNEEIVVWNQDYHLMQIAEILKALLQEENLPKEVRKKISIGHFMHTPFFNIHEIQGLIRSDKRKRVKDQIYDPFAENIETVLKKLTWGMLSNDFVGFHTKEYCDNYLEALEEWFPVEIKIAGGFYEIIYQDHITTIGPFPIGLDVEKILSEVSGNKPLKYRLGRESLLKKMNKDKEQGMYVFGGLERCDYTKGLIERLGIFQHTLNNLKNLKKDARLYQVTSPSRLGNPDYQKLKKIIDYEISSLNRKLRRKRIIHLDEGISVPQNYRFMKEVDVMLVTPLEDGMNLVALEYILSQKYREIPRRGVLVLSQSGAARVLKEKRFGEDDGIVYVNPLRPKDAGDKLFQALKKGRHISERVIEYVEAEHRVDKWADMNINAILNCKKSA
ncbi:MAG: trehalose-6-phosphate synthase [Deltaproteobacteria bacterium]|nr:trehalose-6-phosphate synthase [Deltaproteobacteria bacterium]